jgi:succinylglutamic semialdehyde dehydrogenase
MNDLLQSFDPATGEAVWEGPAASSVRVVRAVEAARKAFPAWATTALADRIAVVRAYKAELEARAEPLAGLISRETGKPFWEGRAEVSSMVGKVELSIAAQAERAGAANSAMPFGEAVLRHNPHGVMAVLGPYNFPGHLPNGHIVPALLAGNTVVFKPSELTPAVGEAMADAWRAAGLPQDVLTVVPGERPARRSSARTSTGCCSPARPPPARISATRSPTGRRSSSRWNWAATTRLSSGTAISRKRRRWRCSPPILHPASAAPARGG